MTVVYIALGSNVGSRDVNIDMAIKNLDFLEDLQQSNLYEFQALLPKDHHQSWNKPFINAAVRGKTNLEPKELHNQLKKIEIAMGRGKVHKRWAPREIDLDIIFYGDKIYQDNSLIIPHEQMHKRDFVLLPLIDLDPNLSHPILKKSVLELYQDLGQSYELKIIRTKNAKQTDFNLG